MRKIQILVFVFLLAGCASLQSGQSKSPEAGIEVSTSPSDCPVTIPGKDPVDAPETYSSEAPWDGFFWYGSANLWTVLRTDGVWAELPLNPEGYTQKIMWWSSSYNLPDELQPELVVTGHRLDAEAPPLKFYGATNASADDLGEAMLTGVDFPTLGCWEITGQYKKTELTFVGGSRHKYSDFRGLRSLEILT